MLPRQGLIAGRGSAALEPARPPVSLTRLVGRSREIAEVERLTGSSRLVTLTGVGGSGKTRLASEVASRTDAVWVDLATCSDSLLVAQQAAAALSLRETAERDTVDALIAVLRERELLLVLDSCEHVIDAAAALACSLLSHCPALRVLATSREPLGIQGEQVWLVPPLAINTDAVELFVTRAEAIDPSFALTDTNRDAVTEICRRLDGIPLAIELAAARVRLLTPEQIAARLGDRFSILGGSSRTSIARHRTLRAAIDWSFALLNEREQKLLERLSVFAGSFALDAVESVASGGVIDRDEVLDLLGGLVDKSLVVSSTTDSSARYSLLETIRQYAAERLTAGEIEDLRRRHATTFLALARSAVPDLMNASVCRLEQLDPDHDNIRAALSWSLENEPDELALPLAAAFRWYWYYRINWTEGLRWLNRVLERSSTETSLERAATLTGAGALAGYLGDTAAALLRLEEAEAMWRALGEERHLGYTLSARAHLLAGIGDLEKAHELATESIALVRKAGTPWDLGYCLTNAAAFVAQVRGELAEADRHLEDAERIYLGCGHALGVPFVQNARALLALRRGDQAAAKRFALTALAGTRARRDLWFSSRSLRVIAYTSSDDPMRAARLLAASDAMLRAMAAGILPYEKSEHERLTDSLRDRLAPDVLEAAMEEGSRMSFDDACALALASEVRIDGPPVLQVRDLGALQVSIGGEPLALEGRSSGRARELLVFLLSHPNGVTKEEVGVAFWPDASTEAVKNSFHVTLHRLRKMMGGADAVRVENGRYRINPELPQIVDSRRFEQEVSALLNRVGSDPGLLGRLDAALSLYTGDFLQGEDAGDWCLSFRAHLRQLYLRGLYALGQGLETRGRFAEAAEAYTRLLAREPLDEAACRQLMICRARLGARSESMLLFRRLEQRLRDDLAAAPENETVALYKRLKQNESV
jgi:predicted ATPase/DNA-binding SARP family transcriptional activator